jgi:hypothetical protein
MRGSAGRWNRRLDALCVFLHADLSAGSVDFSPLLFVSGRLVSGNDGA